MENRKIDRLFREKLANQRTAPSAAAWDELESLIDKKNKKAVFWYYRIAAAIALLIVSGILVFQFVDTKEGIEESVAIESAQDQTEQPIVEGVEPDSEGSLITAEDAIENNNVAKASADENIASELKIETEEVISPETTQQYLVIMEEKNDDGEIVKDSVVLQFEDMLAADLQNIFPESPFDDEEVPVTDTEKKKPAVRITYKSAPKKVVNRRVVIVAKIDTMRRWKPDFRNILKVPGSLLADVRNAKDFLFNQKSEYDRTTQNSR